MTGELFPGVTAADMAKKQEEALKKQKEFEKRQAELAKKAEEEMAARAEKKEKADRAKKLKRATAGMRKTDYRKSVVNMMVAAGGASLVSAFLGLLAVAVQSRQEIYDEESDAFYVEDIFDMEIFYSGYSYNRARENDLLFSFWANVVVTAVLTMVFTSALESKKRENREILEIQLERLKDIKLDDVQELQKFVKSCDIQGYRQTASGLCIDHRTSYKVILEIIKGLSKNDRAYFDKMMTNPNDIKSQEMFIAVIKGHLKTHPQDLDKLFHAFDPASIPDEIRTTYEKERKNRTISWDQALEQYKQNMAHTK